MTPEGMMFQKRKEHFEEFLQEKCNSYWEKTSKEQLEGNICYIEKLP